VLPVAARPEPDHGAAGVEVWRDRDGTVSATSYRRGRQHCLRVPNVGTFLIERAADVVHLVPERRIGEQLIDDAWHRIALPLALQLHGVQVLHASAVLVGGVVVACCGPSGAGKSTLAYAMARRRHEPWADDAVAFATTGPTVTATPLPFRIRLRPQSAAWFDDLAQLKGAEHAAPWQCGPRPLPFRALIVLEREEAVTSGTVSARRLAPAEAFAAVLPHAYYLSLEDERLNSALVRAYLELVDRLPVLALRYPPALTLVDEMVDLVESAVEAL
jgi:hypothetical protein